MFVASQGYKSIQSADTRPQRWSTGPVQVSDSPMGMKGTLLESTAGGPGGGAVPAFYEPGIVSKLFEPLGVADLFGQLTDHGLAGEVRERGHGDVRCRGRPGGRAQAGEHARPQRDRQSR